MTTLRILTERIRELLAGGYPSVNDRAKGRGLEFAVIAACSNALRISTLEMRYTLDGGSIPDGAMVATYEGEFAIPVTRGNKGTCRAMLPAQPMQLPERVGVFSVYPSGEPDMAFMFIPPGLINVWRNNKLLNPIDTIMFTAESKYVEIYADLIGAGITSVDMKLCVLDLNTLGDYDPLPISADMENAVIEEVLKIYGVQPKTERKEGREASPA